MAGGTGSDGRGLGAALGFGLLWGTAAVGKIVLGKDALGGGDVKIDGDGGAFLGPAECCLRSSGSLLARWYSPDLAPTGKLVPFGIFLSVGAGSRYTWGDAIVAWYAGSILGLS